MVQRREPHATSKIELSSSLLVVAVEKRGVMDETDIDDLVVYGRKSTESESRFGNASGTRRTLLT